ncbi:unnamed protein product, partial [marine sediment metagenome]
RILGEAYMALGLLHEKKEENDLAIKNFNKAVETFKDLDQTVYINSAYGEIIRFYMERSSINKDLENVIDNLINKTKRIIF